jgi:DNA-directed RNA polymerase specialized sigma24 family protein
MPSPDPGSVTRWIPDLIAGSNEAAQRLWNRWWNRLTRVALTKLRANRRRAVEDEEDAALSAFDTFCRGAAGGRFPRLRNRHQMWRLLSVITRRKAIDQVRRHGRLRRGGEILVESLREGATSECARSLTAIEGREPTPEAAAMTAESRQQLLDGLGDEVLRQIALLKLDGYTDTEIAGRLGCSLRSVERKLALIRLLQPATDPD